MRAVNVSGPEEANREMENNPNAIFFYRHDRGMLELHGYPCVISHAKATYLKNSMAFGFQKNSPYRKLFSYFLLKMRQSGQIDKLLSMHETQLYTMKTEHEACHETSHFFQTCLPNEPNCVPSITLKTVWTALLILSLGVLFGAIVVLFEWLDYHGYLNKLKSDLNNAPNYHLLRQRRNLNICFAAFITFTILLVVLLYYYTFMQDVSYGQLNILHSNGAL